MRPLLDLFMGRKRATPAHVQEAMDASADATDATDRAREAVESYWKARVDQGPRILTQYEQAERDRRRRIAR